MILPTKHLLSQDSLIGVGGLVMANVGKGTTVSKLWEQIRGRREVGSYERFILALDTMHLLGFLGLRDGLLVRLEPDLQEETEA
ncbi:MAG: hypothetical protein PF961_07685 [Planctomycetota bacterium]|jgi:hypothetical protein|nr:hypothetical protein [Planctomycetota bacterium]